MNKIEILNIIIFSAVLIIGIILGGVFYKVEKGTEKTISCIDILRTDYQKEIGNFNDYKIECEHTEFVCYCYISKRIKDEQVR